MSNKKDNNEQTVITLPSGDMTFKDIQLIEKFKEGGMLNLAKITDIDVERAMSLYIDGKNYREIAHILKIKKDVILYLSQRFDWYSLRSEFLEELKTTLPQKVIESKLKSQEFFLTVIMAYQKKIGRDVIKFLKTDDEQYLKKLDVKELNILIKINELVHKLGNENFANPNSDKSLVALNGMGEGVEILRTGENSVQITPKGPSQFSSKLKAFADMKRNQEKDNQPPPKETYDISNESKPQPEKEEKK